MWHRIYRYRISALGAICLRCAKWKSATHAAHFRCWEKVPHITEWWRHNQSRAGEFHIMRCQRYVSWSVVTCGKDICRWLDYRFHKNSIPDILLEKKRNENEETKIYKEWNGTTIQPIYTMDKNKNIYKDIFAIIFLYFHEVNWLNDCPKLFCLNYVYILPKIYVDEDSDSCACQVW